MTDFLNDLIARSTGTPETVRPRAVSVFEPAEPGAWPLQPEADAAGPEDRARAVMEDEPPEFAAAARRDVRSSGDFAPQVRFMDPQATRAEAGAPETGRATEAAAPRPAPRAETEPGPAPPIRLEPRRPDPAPTPPEDVKPSAGPAEASAPPAKRDPPAPRRRESAADRSGGEPSARARSDSEGPSPVPSFAPQLGEDALARLLRKMVAPRRATDLPPVPAPDKPAPPLIPMPEQTGEPSGQARSADLRPSGPGIPLSRDEALAARDLAGRAEAGDTPPRRRAAAPPRAGPAVTRLTPLPEPVRDFPPAPPTETTVHITIGRIEVRAGSDRPEPATPRRPQPKLMSLDDYLDQRSAGDG